MKTALFVSPHLDDVGFSCGGTLARLSAGGWRTILVTAFTRSVRNPRGFALECQLDKGLPAGVDYMKIRREEDRKFAARAGAAEALWLGHPEAPHRGYESAPELFGAVLPEDEVWVEVAGDLEGLVAYYDPEAIFLPQGLGGHVDHWQGIRASLEAVPPEKTFWYRDAPYAIRAPEARPSPLLPDNLFETGVSVSCSLQTKLDACAAYGTQLGFQFGGEAEMRAALSRFAVDEARRAGRPGSAEVFLAASAQPPL